MRPLALHASALSDAEYDVYTASLRDLTLGDDDADDSSAGGAGEGSGQGTGGQGGEDAYFEKMAVGVREARAWLRGRYVHVATPVIDGILRLFSPTLAAGAVLSGSEFFAVLRLVVHAQSGKAVERSLAFVQADPTAPPTATSGAQSRSSPSSQAPSPAKRFADLPAAQPPPMPSRRPTHTEFTKSSVGRGGHNLFSVPPSTPHELAQPPPLHPSQRPEPARSVAGSQHSHSHSHSTHNPFVQGSSTTGAPKIPPLPPRKPAPPVPSASASGSNVTMTSHTAPPPPPRSVSVRRAPERERERSISPAKKAPPPPPPHAYPLSTHPTPTPPLMTPFAPTPLPKPAAGLPQHVTSTLMKQSLHASKVAQSMKRAEEMLEKERVMQVLKRSGAPPSSSAPAPAVQPHSQSQSLLQSVSQSQHQLQHPFPAAAAGSTLQLPAYAQGRRTESPQRWETGSTSASSASASASASAGASGSAPPLPRRRAHTHGQPSPALSASSWEQVARAGAGPGAQGYGGYDQGSREREQTWARDRAREREWGQDRDRERHASRHRDGSASPARAPAPPTHPDRKPFLYGGIAAASTSAFDAVYGGMGMPSSASSSPVRGTFPPGAGTGAGSGGGSENSSPTARVFRSKSMHYASGAAAGREQAYGQSSGQAPAQGQGQQLGQGPPPVRRRRPESVQVLSSGAALGGGGVGSLVSQWNAQAAGGPGAGGEGGMSVHRRSSLSVAPSHAPSYEYDPAPSESPFRAPLERAKTSPFDNPPNPGHGAPTTGTMPAGTYSHHPSPSQHTQHQPPRPLASLQRTFAALQPRLDAARYKAEAGLAGRRGFIPHGGEAEREDVGFMERTHPRTQLGSHSQHRRADTGDGYASDDTGGAPGVDRGSSSVSSVSPGPSPARSLSPSPPPSDGPGDGDGDGAWRRRVRPVGGGGTVGMVEKDSLKWPAGEGWRPL